MAEVGLLYPTLSDLQKQLDPKGQLAAQINIMTQKWDFLKVLPMIEANGLTSHQASVLVGLPEAAWRKLNGGTIPSTDSHAQIVETIGMLDSIQVTDRELARISGNPALFRANKAKSHIEGLGQKLMTTLAYADKSTPEKPLGIMPRYSALTGPANSQNVISGGGTGSDQTSVIFAVLSPETVTGIYPRGSASGGVEHTSKDDHIVQNAGGVTGALMEAYYDRWYWNVGLAVLDWRYLVRICNIDVPNLVAKSSAADLPELFINAESRFPDDAISMGTRVILMNRTVERMLRIQLRDDVSAGGGLTYENVGGVERPFWNGWRILITDALLNTEAQVT